MLTCRIIENDNYVYTDAAAYRRLDAVMGDTVIMWCNTTSSSGADWIRNSSSDGYGYVYVNGTLISLSHGIVIEFSVVDPSTGDYSLRIVNVHPADTGLYDCYERDGKRIVGYHLVAECMFLDTYERIAV